jgi:hypothetical protein
MRSGAACLRRRQAQDADLRVYRFDFRMVDSLPRLAWCARITRHDPTVVVEHGPWVETFSDAFVEGAWNGTFAAKDFAGAEVFLGSGGRLAGDRVAFTTTTHTMERLQSVRVGNALFVSNSFAYLLAVGRDQLDLTYRLYERDFQTFMNGYHRAKRAIRTSSGRTVRLHYNETFLVNRDLSVAVEKPPLPPEFKTFAQYTHYLRSAVHALHANVTAPERTITYSPLTTISSGYDSPACTVLAKEAGCTQAVTFPDARPDHNATRLSDLNDSGEPIARYLGVGVASFRRDAYRDRHDFPEAEFVATGNGGDDVVMSALEAVLPRTLLFTGFLGDTLWGTGGQNPEESRQYRYRFPAGSSLGEFRVRVGFIHAPVPLFTFARHPELDTITRSPDMRPWSVGGDYDRPIPRRIVESCGVPREAFGREKKAITQPLWITPAIETFLSKASCDDLLAFQKTTTVTWHGKVAATLRTLRPRILDRIARTRFHSLLQRAGRAFPWALSVDGLDRTAFVLLTSVSGVKFHWAIDKVSARYRGSKLNDPSRY